MRIYPVICVIAIALCGCVSITPRTADSHAIVNDVTGTDVEYQVVAVDGKPVERLGSFFSIRTVVPYVVVEPGTHSLSLMPRSGETMTVSASFAAGKRYRLNQENDVVTVVEDTD
jgi:hypothetical protein